MKKANYIILAITATALIIGGVIGLHINKNSGIGFNGQSSYSPLAIWDTLVSLKNNDWVTVIGNNATSTGAKLEVVGEIVSEYFTATSTTATSTFPNIDVTNLSLGLTSGSVPFSNGSHLIENNANLFWDNTNNRLGIGTITPATPLDVNGIITATGGNSTEWNLGYDHSLDNSQAHSDYLLNSGDTGTGDYIFNQDVQIGTQNHGGKLSVGDYSASVYGDFSGSSFNLTTAGTVISITNVGIDAYVHRPQTGQGIVNTYIRGRGTLEAPLAANVTDNLFKIDVYAVTNSTGGFWQSANFEADLDGALGRGKWLFRAQDQVTSNDNNFVVSSVTGTIFNQLFNDNDSIFNGDTAEIARFDAGTENLEFPDNKGITFGTGDDAEVYYDNTDLIINPAVVGTGHVKINGKHIVTNKYFMAYDSVGDIDISTGWTVITWDTEKRKDALYTHTADSENVTLTIAGDYKVTVDISTYITTGAARSTSEFRLLLDGTEIDGTRGYMYNRTAAAGENSASVTFIFTATANQVLRVEAERLAGTDTVKTLPDGCRITIELI